MLTSNQATARAKDWAQERNGNAKGQLIEQDLEQAWLSGYYAARHAAKEDEDKLRQAFGDNAPDRYR